MPKYMTLPVEVEARQFDGSRDSFEVIADWLNAEGDVRKVKYAKGETGYHPSQMWWRAWYDHDEATSSWDWIIKNADGEFSVCKAEEFARMYTEKAS